MKKEKIKIDPITQARQAVTVFKNLKDACKMLNDMVDYNIGIAEKRLSSLEAKEEAELEKGSENQTSMFNS